MYNIPEEKRQIRDELRKELMWIGFGSLSNGAGCCQITLREEINLLISKYKIEEYVHLFLSEYVGPQSNYII